ncbi:oocyte zinc finger protein XlCOF6-like [Teleopsis dalmanni]|uniref:oocyte zinc finger protein XlCOF6-like n=1 Tax=Teleopsis dalmanni TaxID=139649 RepID=UPI0018CCD3C8|nr:oocyte zinc finger protein XlCOF6-like [Teleopsis dalmanni]
MTGSGAAAAAAAAATATRCPSPFVFPFNPLGLGLFDIDPSRILSMLHHQTWLAEEALRNRGFLTPPKDITHRFNPLNDLLSKEYQQNHLNLPTTNDLLGGASTSALAKHHQQQQQQHRSNVQQQQQYKQQQQQQHGTHFNMRYPSPALFFHHQHHQQQQQSQQHHLQKHNKARQSTPSPHQTATNSTQSSRDSLLEELKRKSEASLQRDEDDVALCDLSSHNETDSGRESGSNITNTTSTSSATAATAMLYKDSLEQLLQRRRSSSSLGDMATPSTVVSRATSTPYTQQLPLSNTPGCADNISCKEKSSSSSTSSTPPPTSTLLAQHQQLSQMLKSPSESSLFSEPIEEETRCVVCNAHFPNVWLLEQHAALQHPHIGPGEEKPFICEQCGQSYRYRSAYAKHKEQNHRARLPADKLFTCDVCGMQFRYLKSFKKHRLNHALERLHGKKGKHIGLHNVQLEQDIVNNSQELAADEGGEDLRINIKREPEEDERETEQEHIVDATGAVHFNENNVAATSLANSAERDMDATHSTNKRPRLLTTTHLDTEPPHYTYLQQQQLPPHLHAVAAAAAAQSVASPATHTHPIPVAATAMNSLSSLNSITSLINAERIPSEQFLGLNPQEASILNFLRVDAAERQRDKRPQTSRFACPFCGKCVRSKENLKLHVRKHTGERPFVCLFCGRAFGGKSDLTRHLRIHTGERPYHCESCGKCFARADYLSKHLTTHIHNAPR